MTSATAAWWRSRRRRPNTTKHWRTLTRWVERERKKGRDRENKIVLKQETTIHAYEINLSQYAKWGRAEIVIISQEIQHSPGNVQTVISNHTHHTSVSKNYLKRFKILHSFIKAKIYSNTRPHKN